ncbi:MAG: [FeFe] hydrogenase H-cluster maturation GTPase HydF [Clostridia bacterium]|nr:[FeFe] hydrogenase H-cluster maturation GTPase HydF [Clostridia bacterium]
MSLNSTPSANRVHIGFFGCRNAGKSSLVNAVTGQELAVVSDVKGTTTDPVSKAMELLPLGPVVIIDTPGYDDEGALGEKRVRKTKQTLNKTDIAVLVVDGTRGMNKYDFELLSIIKEKNIPYIIVYNKSDAGEAVSVIDGENCIAVSAEKNENIYELKERIGKLMPSDDGKTLVDGIMSAGDTAVLVIPIDEAAPKGRLILPQQQVIRDILDIGGCAVVTKETELAETLDRLKDKPKVVITDSQAFAMVSKIVPEDVPLTSFSILMARYKGFLETAYRGVHAIDELRDGDTVLIAEGCTHHRQCGDIGTVKIPRWLAAHTGKKIEIKTCSGSEFPEDLTPYAAVIHCGGCMLSEREVQYRMKCACDFGVPFTNYGIFIAYVTGILERSVKMIPEIK